MHALALAALYASGFRAISDDDFARIAISQDFTRSPSLDPSGTSWLPVPLLWTGLWLRLVGPSLEVARTSSALTALFFTAALHRIAAQHFPRKSALFAVGALVLMPWFLRFGLSSGSELFGAALALGAVFLSKSPSSVSRGVSAGCITLATLSRYEVWVVALVLSGFHIRERRPLLAAASCLGPFGWLLHTWARHGSPTAFIDRVRSYQNALGGPSGAQRLAEALLSFDGFVLLVGMSLLFALVVLGRRAPASVIASLPMGSTSKPFEGLLGILFCATAAQVTFVAATVMAGSSATHHHARLLCFALMTAHMVLGAVIGGAGWRTSLPCALIALLNAYTPTPRLTFPSRDDELRIAEVWAQKRRPEDRILIDAHDYGFLAFRAASNGGESVIPSRPVDPRVTGSSAPSPFADCASLQAHLNNNAIAWTMSAWPGPPGISPPEQRVGPLGLWRAETLSCNVRRTFP